MKERSQLLLLGGLFLIILVAGFLLQDWSYIGSKVKEGELVEGPAVVRLSLDEDRLVVLKKGDSIEVKGREIIFHNLSQKDLEGWEIVSLP